MSRLLVPLILSSLWSAWICANSTMRRPRNPPGPRIGIVRLTPAEDVQFRIPEL